MGAGYPRDVIFTMTLEGDASNLREWERPLMERALHEARIAAQEAFFRSLLCESRNEENHRRPPLAGPGAPPPYIPPPRSPSPPRLRSVRDRTPTPAAQREAQPLPPLSPTTTSSSAPGGTRVPVVLASKRLPSVELKSSSSEEEDSSFHPSDNEEATEAWCREHMRKKRVKRPSPSSSSSSSSSDEE